VLAVQVMDGEAGQMKLESGSRVAVSLTALLADCNQLPLHLIHNLQFMYLVNLIFAVSFSFSCHLPNRLHGLRRRAADVLLGGITWPLLRCSAGALLIQARYVRRQPAQ